ncbi:MAG: polyprenyl synthetase family protein, partial [Bacteroidetes bacterium]
ADRRIPENARQEPSRLLEAQLLLVKASGYRGMIGGQVIDLESETRDVDLATVEYMHIHKTGALISAALEMGALLGGATPEQAERLRSYGHHFGLAFQITDDILDVEGDAQLMGKQPGSDAAKNKKTYTALMGLKQAKQAARQQVDAAVEALRDFDQRATPLRELARYLLVRRA